MAIKDVIDFLIDSDEFKSFKEAHQKAFLSFIFKTNAEVQVGYHNPDDDQATTFVVKDTIDVLSADSVAKQPNSKVEPLDISNVCLEFEEALQIATDKKNSDYPKIVPLKSFSILQYLEGRTMFNISFFSMDFQTLNIKIDAKTKEILEHSMGALASFD